MQRSFAESDERVRTIALEGGQERIQAAHALQIRGPLAVTGLSASASRSKIFICKPSGSRDETVCANRIVENLARHAFRRPVTAEDLGPLMAFYKSGSAANGFEGGVRDALAALEADRPLVIPGFPMKLGMFLIRITPLPILRLLARFSPRRG